MAESFAARLRARKPGFALYFIFLVAMFVGSAALTIAYVQVQSDREARRAARADARFTVRSASKQLGEQVAILRATVDQLASNPGAAQAVASPAGCTLTFGGTGGKDGHLDILSLDGAAVCSSRPKDKKGRLSGYVGEPWLRSATTSKLFQAPLTDKATGAPVALFAAPAAGKAVVAGFVNLTTLGSNLDSVHGGNRHAEFLVTGADSGKVIMRSIEPRRWIGSSTVRTGFAPGVRGSERVDVDGKRRIYASSAIPGTRWELFVGEDEAQALAAGKRLRNRQLAILLPSLLLILIATLFVYRRVVVPMKQLSDGVKATGARGQFTPVSVSGPAEVTSLADQINALMASVNAQEAVRRAKVDAERANEAKSRFLTHMSHELRTPLAAITGFAELLQRDATGEKEQKWIAHIVQGGKHLLDLVNELLEISRIEAGEVTLAIEPVDLRATAAEVLSLAAPLATERGIHLEMTAGQAPDRPALGDEMRLRQVLLNLVSNAIKYNREGGTVSVSVDENDDATVRVSVTDTGEGISPEALEKLFNPFERLGAEEGPVEGTGLGLVVTKGLVEAMDGRLHVESVVGTGTTFFFELPTEASAADRKELAQVPAPAAGHATVGNVLYIDDKAANLQLVESVLAELRPGLELRTAMEGTVGAELAEESRPDLLLLDLNLPDMTGEEVLRRLRARVETADVPILSADSTSRNVTRLLQTGADAYLTKPLEVPQFLDVVDRLLAIR